MANHDAQGVVRHGQNEEALGVAVGCRLLGDDIPKPIWEKVLRIAARFRAKLDDGEPLIGGGRSDNWAAMLAALFPDLCDVLIRDEQVVGWHGGELGNRGNYGVWSAVAWLCVLLYSGNAGHRAYARAWLRRWSILHGLNTFPWLDSSEDAKRAPKVGQRWWTASAGFRTKWGVSTGWAPVTSLVENLAGLELLRKSKAVPDPILPAGEMDPDRGWTIPGVEWLLEHRAHFAGPRMEEALRQAVVHGRPEAAVELWNELPPAKLITELHVRRTASWGVSWMSRGWHDAAEIVAIEKDGGSTFIKAASPGRPTKARGEVSVMETRRTLRASPHNIELPERTWSLGRETPSEYHLHWRHHGQLRLLRNSAPAPMPEPSGPVRHDNSDDDLEKGLVAAAVAGLVGWLVSWWRKRKARR